MIVELSKELAVALSMCAVYGVWSGAIFGMVCSLFR